MSCKIQNSTIKYLEGKKAISSDLEVVNPSLFDELNKELTELAFTKYDVGDNRKKLFTTEFAYTNGEIFIKAVPNESLFNLLDIAVADYIDQDLNKNKISKEDLKGYKELFGDKEEVSVEEALDFVSKQEGMKEIGEFFKDKFKDIDSIPVKLINDPEKTFAGRYDSNKITLNAGQNTPYGLGALILHEVMHHFTATELGNFKREDTKALESLFLHASKYLNRSEWYGLTNLDEFAVALFADERLARELKKLPPYNSPRVNKFKNLFEQVLDAILDLFGLSKGDSLYDQAYAVVSNIITDNIRRRRNAKATLEEFQSNQAPMYSFAGAMRGETQEETVEEEEEDVDESDSIFETPNEKFDTENDPDEETEVETSETIELKTHQDRINHAILNINKSININIEKYNQLHHIYKSKQKFDMAEYMSVQKDDFKELKDQINSYSEAQKIRGVVDFTRRMLKEIKKVENKLNKVDESDQKAVYFTIKNYDAALKAFGVIDQLKKNLSEIRQDPNQDLLSDKELEKIEKLVIKAQGQYSYLQDRIHSLIKGYMKNYLNELKYNPEVETKHLNRLRKEYAANEISEDFKSWSSRIMRTRDKAKIEADVKEAVDALVDDPSYDIAASNRWLHSSINTSDTFIQTLEQMFKEMKNKRADFERAKDREFKELFEEVLKEYGTYNPNKVFKNILDYDSTGKQYLKGKYKIGLLEIEKKKKKLIASIDAIGKKYGISSKEYEAARKELHDLNKENYVEKDGVVKPKDKWLNNLDSLTTLEKKVLDFFTDVTEESRSNTYGKSSLVKKFGLVKFYELPKITKTDAERLWTGKFSGTIKDKWKDLTTIRPDDFGFKKVDVDGAGNAMHSIPIHYRDSRDNPMEPNQQSLDLFNVYRLEYKNGIMYKLRNEVELDMDMMSRIVAGKDYYTSRGVKKFVDRRTGKLDVKNGKESNTYKMMRSMMETRLYDILHRHGAHLGKADANKIANFMNGVTSFLGMSFNITSGTANVVNAKTQLFLESFIKGHFITAKGIAKANKIYGKHLAETTKDNVRGIQDSFVNKTLELFDVRGMFDLSEAGFLKSSLIKAGLNSDALRIFQTTGEHWVQSVISMSVLDGVKVMDANSNFIDKEGKVVNSEKEAASLLDMLETDDKGVLQVSDKVVYTTHSKISKWKEGGKEKVDMLIQKKIFDSVGNYTQDMQPELKKLWWGKMLGMYRNYLVPMGVARLRGVESSFKKKDELDPNQLRYSYALQEYEEGTYTSLIRYVATSIKEQQYNILSGKNWNKLSDYEKHNIKRAVTEVVITSALIPLILAAMSLMAGEDGEDDEMLYFVMYQIRRLDSELSQYRSPTELFKIMRSPIPSARILETSLGIFSSVFSFDILDEYESGRFEGYNKTLIKTGKQIPVLKDVLRSYKDLFEFQDSTWGSGL